jgi:hypothetical protein
MSTDYRALCAELANHLQGRKDLECGWPGEDPEQDLLDRARAALAQPEPEGVGDEDLYDLADVFNGDPVPAMRRALELWGRPTIEPVPVSERPWEREKGWRDAEGRCWWFNHAGIPEWQLASDGPYGDFSLPHHALPLPTPTS